MVRARGDDVIQIGLGLGLGLGPYLYNIIPPSRRAACVASHTAHAEACLSVVQACLSAVSRYRYRVNSIFRSRHRYSNVNLFDAGTGTLDTAFVILYSTILYINIHCNLFIYCLNHVEEGRAKCGVGWWMISLNL